MSLCEQPAVSSASPDIGHQQKWVAPLAKSDLCTWPGLIATHQCTSWPTDSGRAAQQGPIVPAARSQTQIWRKDSVSEADLFWQWRAVAIVPKPSCHSAEGAVKRRSMLTALISDRFACLCIPAHQRMSRASPVTTWKDVAPKCKAFPLVPARVHLAPPGTAIAKIAARSEAM